MNITLNNKVTSLIQSGKYTEAVDLLLKELSLNPKDFEVLYNLGYSYRFLEDYDNSTKYYKEALKVNPNIEVAYVGLGVVYQLKEEFNKSLDYFNQAAKINPNNVQLINSMGLTYRKMGNYPVALSVYLTAVQKLFENICLSFTQNKPQPIIKFNSTTSDKWVKYAIGAITRISTIQNIQKIYFPTPETALKLYKNSPNYAFWEDKEDGRFVFPQYFSAVRVVLLSNITYSTLCNNIGNVFNLLGKKVLSKEWFLESVEFIPENSNFLDPYDALHYLGKEGY